MATRRIEKLKSSGWKKSIRIRRFRGKDVRNKEELKNNWISPKNNKGEFNKRSFKRRITESERKMLVKG